MDALDFGFLVLTGTIVRFRNAPTIPVNDAAPVISRTPAFALVERYWPVVRQHTRNDVCRATTLVERLIESLHLPGDVVECGVARGGTALLLALALRDLESTKRIQLFDGFRGLPEPTVPMDRANWYRTGQFAATPETVWQLLSDNGVADRCTIVPGWFSETLPALGSDRRFCLAHIDCDLYQSTADCLRELYPRISPSGAIVCDDYNDGSGGERAAVDAHLSASGEVLHLGPFSQVTFFKGETLENTRASDVIRIERDGRVVSLALDAIRRDARYLDHVAEVLERLQAITRSFGEYAQLCRTGRVTSVNPDPPGLVALRDTFDVV